MDTLLSDIRFALRSLRKQRGFTAIAVVCLALGIGANTAIFSVVRAVLLESLPYGDPSRLVRVYETFAFQGQRGRGSVSVANYLDFRTDNRVFEDLAAYSVGSRDLVGGGQPERVRAVQTTANLFRVLRARPLAGRTFAADEDQPSRPPVVILSEGFWRRRFGGDRRIIGSQISLDNVKHTVIGVMPASFDYPIAPIHSDVWVTLRWDARQAAARGNHWLQVVARLRPGVDSAAATAQMSQVAARLARDYPDAQRDRGIEIAGVEGIVVGRVRPALIMLLGAVGLVLLIACANVANLLLARASGRRREVAIRTALGAERHRLIRQFLTESIVLAVAGGVLGVAVAAWGLKAILGFAASSLPRADIIGLDPFILAFAALVSVATGIAFGIVPALRASQADLREDLAESAGRTGASRRHHRTLDALVVAEIALSLLLVVGAGLLVRGFVALLATDIGLKSENVLTFHVTSPAGRLSDSARYVGFYGPVLGRLRALPGVRGAGMISMLPLQNTGTNGYFKIVGRPPESDPSREPFAEFRVVSSGYFRALGIPVKSGREFDDRDAVGSPPVVIINDEFAKRYFANENPIGRQLFPWSDQPATIVGVVRSVRQSGIDQEARSELYIAAAQNPGWLGDMTYVVSTERQAEALVPMAREAVRAVAPEQPLYLVQTMDRVIADWLRGRKLILVLLSVFAGLALLLSAAGVYGVMSYGVAQRTREIGIRVALGARSSDVTSMVLFDAARLAALGIGIGLVAALAATRMLKAMLYGVGARDPVTFALVAALIGVVALVASAIPALRAARVDPLQAMRTE
jgi:predicted permease